MNTTVWRIVKKKHETAAFSGEGARIYGGRWTSPGKRVIYTAESVSLAFLEVLVHLDSSTLHNYIVIPATVDDSVISSVDATILPANWKRYPAPTTLRSIGDSWFDTQVSLVLRVPSVIVPQESNYLINPEHPQFTLINIGDPVPFEIDLRLFE